MRKKSNPIKIIIVFVIFMVFCVGVFFYLSNRTDENVSTENSKTTVTAVDEVLARNLDMNYPPSPKEVVKYYSEITRCFYGEKYTEDQLVEMADKSRVLFDDELYNNQTDAQYLQALKNEIVTYKEEDRVISSFSVSSSIDVDEYVYEGREYAQLYCIYSIRTGTSISPIQERYILRKDSVGHWKILGFKKVDDMNASGE